MPGTGVPESSHVDSVNGATGSGPGPGRPGSPDGGAGVSSRRIRLGMPALVTIVAMLAVLGLATGLRVGERSEPARRTPHTSTSTFR